MKAWTIQADFGRPDEYQTLIERAQQMAGGLDILINNASIFPTETLRDLNWSGLSANMEVNPVPFIRYAASFRILSWYHYLNR